jgi:AraC-like DNA-binding protein
MIGEISRSNARCLADMRTTIFSSPDRRRLERAADLYLRWCYRNRTAARATEFAEIVGWTQSYLSRFVAAVAGLSVRDYLRRRQLVYAAYLLRATPLANREIALASAFGTPSTFYRCFVAAYGRTPAMYRCAPAEITGIDASLVISRTKVMKCE